MSATLLLVAQDPVLVGLLALAGLMTVLLALGLLQLIFAPPASMRREHDALVEAFRSASALVQTQASKLTPGARLLAGGGLLLVALFLAAGATASLIQSLRQGVFNPFDVVRLALGLGLAGAVAHVFLALRQFSALEIKLSSPQVRLGEEVEVWLQLTPRNNTSLDRLVARLISQEHVQVHERGSRPQTITFAGVQGEAILAESQPLAAGLRSEYRCRLRVPATAMHSHEHLQGLVRFAWRVEVEASMSGAPAALRQAPLKVLPEVVADIRAGLPPQPLKATEEQPAGEQEVLEERERQTATLAASLSVPEIIASSGQGVSIELARQGPFRLGEELSGRLRVQSQEPLHCQGTLVALICTTTADHIYPAVVRQVQGQATEVFAGSAPEQKFSFRLPSEPMTHQGKNCDISWLVRAEVKLARQRDWTCEVPIKVLPALAATSHR